MAKLSKSAFAKAAGVSRQAVYKAIEAGSLFVRPDGKLDDQNPVNQDFINKARREGNGKKHKDKAKTKASGSKTSGKNIISKANTGTQGESIVDFTQIDFDNIESLKGLKRSDVERLKIIQEVRLKELKIKQDRLELIPRIMVAKIFGKLYSIDVNQWRTLGPNLAPEIAAEAGLDDPDVILRIEKIIEGGVFDILGDVKRVFDDFLTEIKAEQLNESGDK